MTSRHRAKRAKFTGEIFPRTFNPNLQSGVLFSQQGEEKKEADHRYINPSSHPFSSYMLFALGFRRRGHFFSRR